MVNFPTKVVQIERNAKLIRTFHEMRFSLINHIVFIELKNSYFL